jgi:glycosyltransferase involved in cell wall biosynthesis
MKLMVVDIPAQTSGGLSVLTSFYNHVLLNEKEHDWFFVLSTPKLKEAKHIKCLRFPNSVNNKINRVIFEEIKLKQIINKYKPDAILSLQNTAFNNTEIPQVVYLHNCLAFQESIKFSFFKKKDRALAFQQYIVGSKIKNSIKKAEFVVVQSEWFKRRVIKEVGKSTNVLCVNNGHEFIDFSVDKNKFDYKETTKLNTFIYPASNYSYKNHKILIEAVVRLRELGISDFQVLLTISKEEFQQIEGYSKEIQENFVTLGYIAQESLIDLYQNSVLVYPSFFESMGLPLYESKYLGGCIIAADCEYAKEALGDYPNSSFFSPNSSKELSDLMSNYIKGLQKYNSYQRNEKKKGWKDIVNLLEYSVFEKK